MKINILKIFATAIAFTFCGVGISVFMWAIEASGHELIPGHQVEDWFAQGTFIVIYASLAGFLVDAIRWLTAVAWVPVRRQAGQAARKRQGTEVCLSD